MSFGNWVIFRSDTDACESCLWICKTSGNFYFSNLFLMSSHFGVTFCTSRGPASPVSPPGSLALTRSTVGGKPATGLCWGCIWVWAVIGPGKRLLLVALGRRWWAARSARISARPGRSHSREFSVVLWHEWNFGEDEAKVANFVEISWLAYIQGELAFPDICVA